MEAGIAAVLLIGAFALGHSTADQEAAGIQAPLVREGVVEPLYDDSAPQGCRYCVDGPVQRDLTLPYTHPQSNDRTGAKETRGAYCSD